jgi:hypothetical protein
MAQAAVNAVIQAFQRGMEQVQQAHAQKQQREEYEKTLEFQKSEQADRKAQLDVTNKANEKLFNLQKAQIDAQQAQTDFANAQMFQKSGITPPGAEVIPGVKPTPSQPLVLSGLENTQLVPPSGRTLSVPPLSQNPEQQLIQQQTRETEDRAEARQTRIAAATGQIQLENQLKLLDAQFPKELSLATIRNNWDKEKIRMQQEGENYRANLANSTRLKIGTMAKQGLFSGMGGSLSFDEDGNPIYSSGDPTNMLANLIPDIASGKVTQEDIQKQFPTAKDRTALGSILAQANIHAINNKERTYINDLQSASSLLPKIAEMYQELNEHPYSLLLGFGTSNERFNQAKQVVEGNRALLVRVLEGVNRYTYQQALDKSKELIPEVSAKTVFTPGGIEAQNKKYEFFVKEMLQDNFNKAAGHLPASQQKAIRGRIDLPDIGQALSQPGGEHPQIPGTTAPQVLNNPQPTEDRVIVYDRKTGRTGSQLKKFVDKNPSRYQIMGTPGGKK